MPQSYFLIEYNLSVLQTILRSHGHSAFLTTDKEIGLVQDDDDFTIIKKALEQKINLGVDRIIITKDNRFITHLGKSEVKIIVLVDKMYDVDLYHMRLKDLCNEIISKVLSMSQIKGQAVDYIECSKFY